MLTAAENLVAEKHFSTHKMKFLPIICTLSISICFVNGACNTTNEPIYKWKPCKSDSDCPVEHTICDILGCEGRVCQCPRNMTMDESGYTCKITKQFGEACNPDTDRCVFIGGACLGGVCRCGIRTKQDTANDCIPIANPNKIFGNKVYQPYGAMCDSTNDCAYQDNFCMSGRCSCPARYRPATFDEINALPFDDSRCRLEGYMAHEWNATLCGQYDLKIGNQCGTDDLYKCPANASCLWKEDCSAQMCVCDEGFVTNRDFTACLPPKHYGETCDFGQCVDFGNVCNITCQCHTLFAYRSGRCRETWLDSLAEYYSIAGYGENCNSTFTPSQLYTFCSAKTICDENSGTCVCRSGHVLLTEAYRRYKLHSTFVHCVDPKKWFLTDAEYNAQCIAPTTPEPMVVGRNCTLDNRCPSESECIMFSCSKKCVCKEGYIASGDRTHCVTASNYGENCIASENCAFKYGECVNGACRCESLSTKTSDDQCSRSNENPTGSPCSSRTECFGGNFGVQECVTGMCKCASATMRDMTPLEIRDLTKDATHFRCLAKDTPRAEDSCDPNATTTTATTTPTTTTTQPTTTTPQAVDGMWSPFGPWSACSLTCGLGTRTRTRECNNPTPAFGGAHCVGSNTNSESCNQHNCTVKIDEVCDIYRTCPANAACESLYTGGQTCRCDIGYTADTNKVGCIGVVFYGDSCDATVKCAGEDAECNAGTGKCDCDSSYTEGDEFYCLSGHLPYIKFKSNRLKENGDDSSTTCGVEDGVRHSCYETLNLVCNSTTNGFCKCKDKFRRSTHLDRLAAPSTRVYCVYSNWTSGYRPLRGSPEAFRQDDESLEDIVKEIETARAEEERKERNESAKLIIAACLAAVGVFAVVVFIAFVTRKVIRKRHQKTIDPIET